MREWDSAIGLLATVSTVALLALVARGEGQRLASDRRAWEARTVETGAWLFEQHCARCHGRNASGGLGPPLDGLSGLQGGDRGRGVAWRLEELGWDRHRAYEYIYQATAAGRTLSTRPQRYPGARLPATSEAKSPERTGVMRLPMAMPAWAQQFGGPLRPDQVDALARYLTAFPAVPTPTGATGGGAPDVHSEPPTTASVAPSMDGLAGGPAAP